MEKFPFFIVVEKREKENVKRKKKLSSLSSTHCVFLFASTIFLFFNWNSFFLLWILLRNNVHDIRTRKRWNSRERNHYSHFRFEFAFNQSFFSASTKRVLDKQLKHSLFASLVFSIVSMSVSSLISVYFSLTPTHVCAHSRQFNYIFTLLSFPLLQELNGSYWRKMKSGRSLTKLKDFARCTWKNIPTTSIVHVESQKRWDVTVIPIRCPIHLCRLTL